MVGVTSIGSGTVKTVTKDKQKFWDALRGPKDRDCWNCVAYGYIQKQNRFFCKKQPGPKKYTECDPTNFNLWEWDGIDR